MDLAAQLSSQSPLVKGLLGRWLEQLSAPSAAVRPEPVAARSLQVQHRLSEDEVAELIVRYQAGASVRELARAFQLHRTTVSDHLNRNGVPRRAAVRKLTDEQVIEVTRLYASGLSLFRTGEQFGVNTETIRKELRRAGVTLRARRGWDT